MPDPVTQFDRDTQYNRELGAMTDGRLDAPAFHRNIVPMLAVLQRVMSDRSGHVLEIGSGTGQHAIEFAKAMPALTWWPSDPDARHRESIEAWRRQSGVENVRAPLALDAADPAARIGAEGAPGEALVAIISMNVIHIAPWSVCEGIMRVAGQHLAPDGLLVLYGPFKRGGRHIAPSNAAFDASLRGENTEWGVRDVVDVEEEAERRGLLLAEGVAMPANNLTLIFARSRT